MPHGTTDLIGRSPAAGGCLKELTPEVLLRTAELVALDEIACPAGLGPDQEARLLDLVRRHRRAQLIQLIARQLAADLARQRTSATETRP